MTPHEISLLKSSLHRIAPIADQAAALFYARLFDLDPNLRDLFQGDMREQGRKLMQAIRAAIHGLDRPEILAPAVRQLGRRHAGDHVTESQYETFGTALLWTLEKGLGPDFTDEARTAWAKTYWLLAETAKAGARDAAAMQSRAVA
jgi:hemoglobin-like flavoprotein